MCFSSMEQHITFECITYLFTHHADMMHNSMCHPRTFFRSMLYMQFGKMKCIFCKLLVYVKHNPVKEYKVSDIA